MGEFWVNVLVNCIGAAFGVIATAILPLVTRRPSRWISGLASHEGSGHRGEQSLENPALGQAIAAQSSETTMIQNISISATQVNVNRAKNGDGDWPLLVVQGLAILAALAICINYYVHLYVFLAFAALGLLVFAMVINGRRKQFSSQMKTGHVVVSVMTLISVLTSYTFFLFGFKWNGMSLTTVYGRFLTSGVRADWEEGLLIWSYSRTVSPMIALLSESNEVRILVLGFVAILSATVIAISSCYVLLKNWAAFVGFAYGKAASKSLILSAQSFRNLKWKDTLSWVLACLILQLVAFALGSSVDFVSEGGLEKLLFGDI